MKHLLIFAAITSLVVGFALANGDVGEMGETVKGKIEKPEYRPFECPKSHMSDQDKCFACHYAPTFGLRECKVNAGYEFPNPVTSFKYEDGKLVGYFFLKDIAEGWIREAADYFYYHKVGKVIVDIHSPGGSLFDAWRIKGIIDEMIGRGIRIETRVYGSAFSAGFLIFCAGQDRVATDTAELMWHELITGEMFAIKTPSDKEDESKILRHLQNTANSWIAAKSKVSKDELDDKVRKKEFWISGKEAFDMGFATKLIGGAK